MSLFKDIIDVRCFSAEKSLPAEALSDYEESSLSPSLSLLVLAHEQLGRCVHHSIA